MVFMSTADNRNHDIPPIQKREKGCFESSYRISNFLAINLSLRRSNRQRPLASKPAGNFEVQRNYEIDP
jgi:hypothetical protein